MTIIGNIARCIASTTATAAGPPGCWAVAATNTEPPCAWPSTIAAKASRSPSADDGRLSHSFSPRQAARAFFVSPAPARPTDQAERTDAQQQKCSRFGDGSGSDVQGDQGRAGES